MALRALVLQHIACEPPGTYEDVLRERGVELERIELDEGDALPDWREFDAIVAMGGPMSAGDDETLPWLTDEKRLIAEAVEAGTPFWGVCLGVQLLAASLGARVYPGPAPEVGILSGHPHGGRTERSGVRLTPGRAPDPPVARRHVRPPARRCAARRLACVPESGVSCAPRVRHPVPHRGLPRHGEGVGRACPSTPSRSSACLVPERSSG